MAYDKHKHYVYKKLNEDSTIADIAKHPIGHDLLQKISMFTLKSDKILDNKLLTSLSLKTISNHTEYILEAFAIKIMMVQETFLVLLAN